MRAQSADPHVPYASMHGRPTPRSGLERWDDVRVLLAVLRSGSFSAASRQLGVEQSTVSRRIAALEESLGAQLFDRLPEGPRPTALAQRLRERAELIESEVLDLADIAHGEDRAVEGPVTLALTESFAVHVLIPHILAALRKQHPGLVLYLLASDQTADLSRREADLALRFYRPASGDLISKRLASLPLAMLTHKRHAQRACSDLSQLDWVSVQRPGSKQPEDHAFTSAHGIKPVLIVSSHLAQVEAVRAGLGVALLTRNICQLDKNIVELKVRLPPIPPVELWLVAPQALRSVPRVAAVWTLLEQHLQRLA
jgi:DNA-binding transcriptional LysR family regulator